MKDFATSQGESPDPDGLRNASRYGSNETGRLWLSHWQMVQEREGRLMRVDLED